MASQPTQTGFITVRDGVRLSYTQTGLASGPELLLIPGWRQTAAQWKKQVAYFSAKFHVTTYDFRGHGESDKAKFGHRVYSYAADLVDLLTQLDLTNLNIVAHSMGSSVVWALWDLYPEYRKRIAKLVVVDQLAVMVANPAWSEEEAAKLTAIFQPETAAAITSDIKTQSPALLKGMHTAAISPEDLEWAMKQNSLASDETAAALLLNHSHEDWRDVLPRITVPTLVIAAEASTFPAAGVQWVATQIPGAKVETFGADEGGSHFMFWENPEKFNRVVEQFLAV